MKNRDDQLEMLLKEAAALYMEQEGETLLSEERADMDIPDMPEHDFSKMWAQARKRGFLEKTRKLAFAAAPVAACLIAALIYFHPAQTLPEPVSSAPVAQLPVTTPAPAPAAAAPSAPAPIAAEAPHVEIQYLSAKLPQGYTLTKTDYDLGKTLYYITNETDNQIVLVAERPTGAMDTEGFTRTAIGGADAYVLARKDYNVLLAQAGDVRYTLTSAFAPEDLVDVAKTLL